MAMALPTIHNSAFERKGPRKSHLRGCHVLDSSSEQEKLGTRMKMKIPRHWGGNAA